MNTEIRIQSEQGTFPTVRDSNVDLIIPGDSGVYDFTKTYIAIGTSITNRNINLNTGPIPEAVPGDVGIFDIRIGLTHGTGSIYNTSATPVECLVKNCSIRSATKGMIDSIRHSDVLRGSLGAYKRDIDSMVANSLIGIAGPCKDVPWVHGNYVDFSQQRFMPGPSREKTHEIRIMLSDLFDIGNVKAWDSAKYGTTYIHLEMNFDRIELTQVFGQQDPTWAAAYQNRTLAPATTTVANGSVVGDQTLAVVSTTGFFPGGIVVIGEGTGNEEIAQIFRTVIGPPDGIEMKQPLTRPHQVGDPVRVFSGKPDLVDYGYATVNTDSNLGEDAGFFPNNFTIQKLFNGQRYLGGAASGITDFVMKCPYDSLEDVPFYVGMELIYEVSVEYGPDPATQDQGYGCKISFPSEDETQGVIIGRPEGAIVRTQLVRGKTMADHLVTYTWSARGTGYKVGNVLAWQEKTLGTQTLAYSRVTQIDTSAGFPLSADPPGIEFPDNLGLGFVVGDEYDLVQDPSGGGTGGRIRCDSIGLEGRLNEFTVIDKGTGYDIGNTGQVTDAGGNVMGAVYVVDTLDDPDGPIVSVQFMDPGTAFVVGAVYESFGFPVPVTGTGAEITCNSIGGASAAYTVGQEGEFGGEPYPGSAPVNAPARFPYQPYNPAGFPPQDPPAVPGGLYGRWRVDAIDADGGVTDYSIINHGRGYGVQGEYLPVGQWVTLGAQGTGGAVIQINETVDNDDRSGGSEQVAKGRAVVKGMGFDDETGIVTLFFDSGVVKGDGQDPYNQAMNTASLDLLVRVYGAPCHLPVGGGWGNDALSAKFGIDKVELVTDYADEEPESGEISYLQIKNQADTFSMPTGTSRTYTLPKGTKVVLISLPVEGDLTCSDMVGSAVLFGYRFTVNDRYVDPRMIPYQYVDGETRSTNPMPNGGTTPFKCQKGSGQHYASLERVFSELGYEYESMREVLYDTLIPVGRGADVPPTGWTLFRNNPAKKCYVIGLAIDGEKEPVRLGVELDGNWVEGGGVLQLFSFREASI